MNLNVLRKNNFIFIFFILTGCSNAPSFFTPEYESPIDVRYSVSRLKNLNQTSSIQTPSLTTYQTILSESLTSGCDHYPTDSGYAKIMFKKCPSTTAFLKTISRFLLEHDAGEIFLKQAIESSKLYYVDLPTCDL